MKRKLSTILIICIFLCGLAVLLYPTISDIYNENLNSSLISDYEDHSDEISQDINDGIISQAREYNKYLYEPDQLEALGLNYEDMLNPIGNGIMGYIEIPKTGVELVIYHSLEEEFLQEGVGHMEGTSLPIGGENTHAVLAAHSGLPTAKLFTDLDHMSVGDRFYIHTAGEILVYMVTDVSVVLPHQVEKLAIESGKDIVTLVTCTPYGINSHRLLVKGERLSGNSLVYDGSLFVSDEVSFIDPIYIIPVGLIAAGVVTLLTALKKEKIKNRHERRK